jgi:hypothetical protein
MASRVSSTSSNGSEAQKPSIKEKSKSLQGISLSPKTAEPDYLHYDLLEDDRFDASSYKYQDPPRQFESDSNDGNFGNLHRLVIAIDYGTTFTGEHAVLLSNLC